MTVKIKTFTGVVYDPVLDCPCRYISNEHERINPSDFIKEFEGQEITIIIVGEEQ